MSIEDKEFQLVLAPAGTSTEHQQELLELIPDILSALGTSANPRSSADNENSNTCHLFECSNNPNAPERVVARDNNYGKKSCHGKQDAQDNEDSFTTSAYHQGIDEEANVLLE